MGSPIWRLAGRKGGKIHETATTAAQRANCFANVCSCACECVTHCAVETSSWYPEEAHSRPYVTMTSSTYNRTYNWNN